MSHKSNFRCNFVARCVLIMLSIPRKGNTHHTPVAATVQNINDIQMKATSNSNDAYNKTIT